MRLTLRTLLAYMDDILDPADQEDLARQVEESEKATELIHRTRDATRRLRLGAPPVIGEGMELDPNFVAEYLDNTMSPEDMTEFQQVCLDSDVHLAEVASCHHILTMVLGEPAEIEPEMRQRMYTVPGRVDDWRQLRVDGPHRVTQSAEAAPEIAAATAAARADAIEDEHISQVPDYLKARDSSTFGRMALAFAAALVLGFGAFMLFGPGGILNRDQQQVAQDQPAVEDRGNGDAPPAVDADDLEASDAETDTTGDAAPADLPGTATTVEDDPVTMLPEVAGPDENIADGDAADGDAAEDNPAAGDDLASTEPQVDTQPEMPEETGTSEQDGELVVPDAMAEQSVHEATGGVVTEIETNGTEANDPGATGTEATDTRIADGNTVVDASEGGAADGQATARADQAAAAADGQGERVAMNTPAVMPDSVTELDPTAASGAEAPAPEAAPLGTMVAPNEVLLSWDAQAGQWIRLPSRSSIVAGDQLLSLPTYRPSLALVSGLRVELCDGATLTADYADDGATPRLEIGYGRFLLQNTDMEPVEVELVVGGEAKRVEIDSTAVLGLDVDRPFVPGADVEQKVGPFVARLYAPGGNVTWNTAENPLPVVTAAQWMWEDVTASSITDDISWLDGQSLDYLLQNVSRTFERQIDTQRPAHVQLLELYESSRRREDKALAAQCGTHVGQFVPFVQALADTVQQSNWDNHITELRRAMARSTQAAKQVHQTLIEQRGASLADDLFEMLRGYSPEQIGTTREGVQSGVTRQLIDWLQHDRLEYRVLAIHNLKEIYGGKTLGYNPVVTEPSRQERAVKLWRTRLADNELIPVYLQ